MLVGIEHLFLFIWTDAFDAQNMGDGKFDFVYFFAAEKELAKTLIE